MENEAEQRRRSKGRAKAQATAVAAGRNLPSPVQAFQRLSQRSVKFIRWLRACLIDRLPWHLAKARLVALYAAS